MSGPAERQFLGHSKTSTREISLQTARIARGRLRQAHSSASDRATSVTPRAESSPLETDGNTPVAGHCDYGISPSPRSRSTASENADTVRSTSASVWAEESMARQPKRSTPPKSRAQRNA